MNMSDGRFYPRHSKQQMLACGSQACIRGLISLRRGLDSIGIISGGNLCICNGLDSSGKVRKTALLSPSLFYNKAFEFPALPLVVIIVLDVCQCKFMRGEGILY